MSVENQKSETDDREKNNFADKKLKPQTEMPKIIEFIEKNETWFSLNFLIAFMHFLFRVSLSFFVFYFLASFSDFLDSNLLFILRSLQVVSAFSTTVASLVFILELAFGFYYKKKFLKKINIIALIIFLLSFVFLIFVTAVIVVSKSNL